jgi:diaminopimelate decarboxylase
VHFIIDNFDEISLLDKVATKYGKRVKGMLRVVPQVEAGGHKYIQTGAIDTKFGFSTHDLTYFEAVSLVLESASIDFIGLHCHTGSQIMEKAPFIETAKAMFGYCKAIYEKFDIVVEQLNIGGGYGIVYEKGQKALGFSEVIHDIMDVLNTSFATLGIKRPLILIEPGRSIVGNACMTLYTIGSQKNIPGVRKYIEIDGGMTDNIRPALYQAKYHAFLVDQTNRTTEEVVTIAGKCCESGDILIKDITLPSLVAGDRLAVPSTGAYNYSMSSNYNQICKPAMVVVSKGQDKLTIRRQSFEDLIACEVE